MPTGKCALLLIAILQPPKPEIQPSPRILERAADRDLDREAAE